MQIQCIGKRLNGDYMGWRGTVNHIYRHAGITGTGLSSSRTPPLAIAWHAMAVRGRYLVEA